MSDLLKRLEGLESDLKRLISQTLAWSAKEWFKMHPDFVEIRLHVLHDGEVEVEVVPPLKPEDVKGKESEAENG